jgi:hypothetical protein
MLALFIDRGGCELEGESIDGKGVRSDRFNHAGGPPDQPINTDTDARGADGE